MSQNYKQIAELLHKVSMSSQDALPDAKVVSIISEEHKAVGYKTKLQRRVTWWLKSDLCLDKEPENFQLPAKILGIQESSTESRDLAVLVALYLN